MSCRCSVAGCDGRCALTDAQGPAASTPRRMPVQETGRGDTSHQVILPGRPASSRALCHRCIITSCQMLTLIGGDRHLKRLVGMRWKHLAAAYWCQISLLIPALSFSEQCFCPAQMGWRGRDYSMWPSFTHSPERWGGARWWHFSWCNKRGNQNDNISRQNGTAWIGGLLMRLCASFNKHTDFVVWSFKIHNIFAHLFGHAVDTKNNNPFYSLACLLYNTQQWTCEVLTG